MEIKKVSLTAMASRYKECGVNRDMILQALIDSGMVEDIRTITEKGKEAGIEYCFAKNGSGAKWPVYSVKIQNMVNNSVDKIKEKYAHLSENKEKEGKKAKHSGKYKYLGLEDFVVIDTETTGLDKDDEIIELSVVSSEKEELYHSTFMPEKDINPFAAKVNHFSKEKLKGSPVFCDEWENIRKVVNGRRVLGHNIQFDKRLVIQTLEKYGMDPKEGEELFRQTYDSKDIAKKHIRSKSYSLNNLTTLIGITREEQHNSTDDCVMTIEFLERLEDILQIKNDYTFVK